MMGFTERIDGGGKTDIDAASPVVRVIEYRPSRV